MPSQITAANTVEMAISPGNAHPDPKAPKSQAPDTLNEWQHFVSVVDTASPILAGFP
jgi:hypothetical protein